MLQPIEVKRYDSARPIKPGYMRLEAAAVDVASGESTDWAQWVGGPLEQDYDLLDIEGAQDIGGHHALLYATSDAKPAGFTRPWTDEDQTTSRLMGGIGGEGGAASKLPPGIVFRVKKGSYMILQTHYLNTQDRSIVGRAYVDILLSPVDSSRTVASLLANTTSKIDIAPFSQLEADVNCKVQGDLRIIQLSNHMHDYGVSTYSEWIDASGAAHMLARDDNWAGDLALNPNFTKYSPEVPLLIPAGSTLHTHCKWNNTTGSGIKFPAEMCVMFGFVLNESDIICNNERWSGTMTPAAATMSSPMSAAAPGPAAPAADGGECASQEDRAILDAPSWDEVATQCATGCAFDPDVAACVTPCLRSSAELSAACAACNGRLTACGASQCRSACLADSASQECRSCVDTMCTKCKN